MFKHVTGKNPKIIDIVACGPTIRSYNAMRFDYDPIAPAPDEIWTVNKALRTVKADVGFVMDDMRGEAIKSDRYRADLNNVEVPIITSIIDDQVKADYPDLIKSALLHEYPINDVLNQIGARVLRSRGPHINTVETKDTGDIVGYYLHNSIPFMLAYALYIGVERIQLFGADYTYPGMAAREDDRANTEYWVGMLRAFGVEIWTSNDTTLLNQIKQPWIYGYGTRPPAREAPTLEFLQKQADTLWPEPDTVEGPGAPAETAAL
jgi:hypothetical protein